MKKFIVIMFLAIAGNYFSASAQKPEVIVTDKSGWHKIGETTVDLTKEKDELLVMGADRFASIKLKVSEAAIDLQDLEIFFEAGDKQDVMVRTPIQAGGESRAIDLKNGAERSIKKIVFVYKTIPDQKNEKAKVEVWGLKTNEVKNQ
jgi:hypothetical protein